MKQIRLCRQEHLWFIRAFGQALSAGQRCGNHCGNRGRTQNQPPATAFYQRFLMALGEEKNLHLHKSRALTFYGLQLGSLMSTVERVSQTKQWLIRSRLSGQVQWSDPMNTRTRKNRQALRGAGWGQELRKQWSHQGL